MDSIFLVTTIESKQVKLFKETVTVLDTRTVAWFNTFSDAQACVLDNRGDICEGLYNYAVIEQCIFGVYPGILARHFYKINMDLAKDTLYDIDLFKYLPIDEKDLPNEIRMTKRYAMLMGGVEDE